MSVPIALTCAWALGCGTAQQATDASNEADPTEPAIVVESLQEIAARLEDSGRYTVEPRAGEVDGVAAGEGLVGALSVSERDKPEPHKFTIYSYETGASSHRARSMSPKHRGGAVSNILARKDVSQVFRCGRELYFTTQRDVDPAHRIGKGVMVATDNGRDCRLIGVIE